MYSAPPRLLEALQFPPTTNNSSPLRKSPHLRHDKHRMNQPPGHDRVAELFDTYAPALLLYARQWVGSSEADDLVQRVFVRLLAGNHLPDHPRPWLFRCIRNEAMAQWRADQRRGRREQHAASSTPAWFVARPDDPLCAREAQIALESLTPEMREVVTLRLWADLTLSEIAEITGVVVSTVHARFAAAIESLRQKLEPPCKTPKH